MFWQLDMTTTNINNLLDKQSVTLQEILDEDDVLQELRNHNHKLLKFLMKDENLGSLVSMIVSEPSEEIEMPNQFKNANIACELLTAEINQTEMFCDLLIEDVSQNFFRFGQFGSNYHIGGSSSPDPGKVFCIESDEDRENDNDWETESPSEEKSSSNNESKNEESDSTKNQEEDAEAKRKAAEEEQEKHIKKLFEFLDSQEINPLLASYFSRTVAELLQRKPEKIWPYIRDKQGAKFLNNVMRHINTSAIWDLLMRLMTCKEASLKTEIVSWLSTQGLIKSLIQNLRYTSGSLRNQAASLALSDIVRLSRSRTERMTNNDQDQGNKTTTNNPLLKELEQQATIDSLIEIIVESNDKAIELKKMGEDGIIEGTDCDSSILSCINVLMTFLEPNTANNFGSPMGLGMAEGIWSSAYANDLMTKEQLALINEHYKYVINMTLTALAPKISYFVEILDRAPAMNFQRQKTSMPKEADFKSLGTVRLNVVKLFVEILKHQDEEMNKIFVKENVLKKMVDLFFEFCWNNFLHSFVTNAIQNIIAPTATNNDETSSLPSISPSESTDPNDSKKEGESGKINNGIAANNDILVENLLVNCELTKRIIAAFHFDKCRDRENAVENITIPFHSSQRKLLEKIVERQKSKDSDKVENSADDEATNTPTKKADNNTTDDDGQISVHSSHDGISENRRKKAVANRSKPPRLAYMGHLTKIANLIYEHTKGNELVETHLNEESYTQTMYGMAAWTRPGMGQFDVQMGQKNSKNEKKIVHDVENILNKQISKDAYNDWDTFTAVDLKNQNERNSKKVNNQNNLNNSTDKYGSYLYNNSNNNSFDKSGQILNNNDNSESEKRINHFFDDDEDEEDYDNGTTVSEEAKDLYKDYSNASLQNVPKFPSSDISQVGSTSNYNTPEESNNTETAEQTIDTDTNLKDSKLQDYNNVGHYEPTLTDYNESERNEMEKQKKDIDSFNNLVRNRISAINQNYEDDDDLEAKEFAEFGKDYSEVIAKDKNEWYDGGEEDDDEDGDENDNIDDENTRETSQNKVEKIENKAVAEFDPWAGLDSIQSKDSTGDNSGNPFETATDEAKIDDFVNSEPAWADFSAFDKNLPTTDDDVSDMSEDKSEEGK